MKEVIAIIRPEKWHVTLGAAAEVGAEEMIHLRVLGRGRQRGLRYLRPHGEEDAGVMQHLPKRLLSWLVTDELVGHVVSTIMRVNGTDSFGDGKIFVCPMEGVMEISPGATPVAVGAQQGG